MQALKLELEIHLGAKEETIIAQLPLGFIHIGNIPPLLKLITKRKLGVRCPLWRVAKACLESNRGNRLDDKLAAGCIKWALRGREILAGLPYKNRSIYTGKV